MGIPAALTYLNTKVKPALPVRLSFVVSIWVIRLLISAAENDIMPNKFSEKKRKRDIFQ